MKNHDQSAGTLPLAIGTGLVALDVVITGDKPQPDRLWSGGTCGNVLLALRYLGWRSAPIARFSKGHATRRVLDDLRQWDVSTEFVTRSDNGSTPVIVHRIRSTANGERYHTFSWRCPNCGTRLPGYKPVLESAAKNLVDRLGTPQVFFLDRVSPGALVLAQASAERGAAIVFEPSAIGNPVLFREAWRLADIVKYSHERLRELPTDVDDVKEAPLQVETLGRDGLRYRSRLPRCRTRTWQHLDALEAEDVKDTAGSGDWCTAGIVHRLLRRGRIGLRGATDASLRDALRYGEALAAWNCGFEGARGGMYIVEKGVFELQVNRILNGDNEQQTIQTSRRTWAPNLVAGLCPSCEEVEPLTRRPRQYRVRSRQ